MRSIRLTVAIVAAGFIFAGGLVQSSPPQPAAAATSPAGTDVVVNPGELQAAVDSAHPGDRILLLAASAAGHPVR